MKKRIILASIFLLLSTTPSLAVDCFSSFSGDQTVSASCTLKTYTDGNDLGRLVSGIDSGTGSTNTATLTVSAGTMTINSTETLVVGDMDLTGGSIAVADGAAIQIGKAMWMTDADADGYPSETKIYVQDSAPTDGVRLNTITNVATADCDDGSYSAANSCCVAATYYQDADGDGYGNPSVSDFICPTSGWVANNTDCNDTGTNSQNVYISVSCYVDADNDNYGVSTTRSCANNATCGSATWASNGAGTTASATNLSSVNTDCYDSNANAYPGSTTCSSTNRGDGSFDYNCSSTETKCGTSYTYSSTSSNYTRNQGTGSCAEANCKCSSRTSTVYATASIGCGQSGATCTTISNLEYGCNPESPCNGNCVPTGTTPKCTAISAGTQRCQ